MTPLWGAPGVNLENEVGRSCLPRKQTLLGVCPHTLWGSHLNEFSLSLSPCSRYLRGDPHCRAGRWKRTPFLCLRAGEIVPRERDSYAHTIRAFIIILGRCVRRLVSSLTRSLVAQKTQVQRKSPVALQNNGAEKLLMPLRDLILRSLLQEIVLGMNWLDEIRWIESQVERWLYMCIITEMCWVWAHFAIFSDTRASRIGWDKKRLKI